MKSKVSRYHRHRFPPQIISHAVWLYHRFCLSFRDIEELLSERGIVVTYETVRQWCKKFGPRYARSLRRRQGHLGDVWHLDEVFVNIQGQRHYLWRAVDQDGDVIDILVQRPASQCLRGQTVLSQAAEGTGEQAKSHRDRQAEELLGSAPGSLSFRGPRHTALCQQSR